jgi:SAM-dependent methyltransferase
MTVMLKHPMKPDLSPADAARGRFVSGLRQFILNDLAADMRSAYDGRAATAFTRATGQAPETTEDVHHALRPDPAFQIYSAMRVQAQRMVWSAVSPVVAREKGRLASEAEAVSAAPGSLTLDPELAMPRNVSAIDVHLLPGSYVGGADMDAGAVYDQGLAIFSMGLMGDNLDDIGLSMSTYTRTRYPAFAPERILDLGCTIGHNTLPWKQAYPNARVDAIDVAAPGLRYASARAKMQRQEIHFHQMSADTLDFPDASMDLVFSSMFLHEVSAKTRRAIFAEVHRVLKPGGLMVHMELPPNREVAAFDGFYLDWDSYYNEEPFYKGFRDEDYRTLCRDGGFADADYIQFVVPSIGIYGGDAIVEAIASESDATIDRSTTGRLAEGVQWFGFGAWKA